MLCLICKFGVNLIRKYIQIMSLHNFGDRLQIFFCHDRSGRVIWERHYQHLCLRCDRCFQFFCRQLEFIFLLKRNHNRVTVCQNRTRHIRHITWLRDQDFISLIQHCTQCHINSFTSSDRHHDLMIRVIFYMDLTFQIFTDLNLQILKTCIRCIESLALFQGVDTFLSDSPWCVKIRFSYTKGYCVRHLTYQIKEFTDSRWFDACDFLR